MKKVFAIFAIAVIMVACGNKADKKVEAPKDSVNKLVDSANKMIDKAADTLKPKM